MGLMDTIKGWFGGNKEQVKEGIDKGADAIKDKVPDQYDSKVEAGRRCRQGRRRQARLSTLSRPVRYGRTVARLASNSGRNHSDATVVRCVASRYKQDVADHHRARCVSAQPVRSCRRRPPRGRRRSPVRRRGGCSPRRRSRSDAQTSASAHVARQAVRRLVTRFRGVADHDDVAGVGHDPTHRRVEALGPLVVVVRVAGRGADEHQLGLFGGDEGDRLVAPDRARSRQRRRRYRDRGRRAPALDHHDQLELALLGDLLQRREPLRGVRVAVEHDREVRPVDAVAAGVELDHAPDGDAVVAVDGGAIGVRRRAATGAGWTAHRSGRGPARAPPGSRRARASTSPATGHRSSERWRGEAVGAPVGHRDVWLRRRRRLRRQRRRGGDLAGVERRVGPCAPTPRRARRWRTAWRRVRARERRARASHGE